MDGKCKASGVKLGKVWTVIRLLVTFSVELQVFAAEPSFRVPEINVTVVEGETAVLPCSIQYLGDYQVVWTDENAFLLTLEDRRIIDDDRISVERPFKKDWNLHIRNVEFNDQGRYICQINTEPAKIKDVSLIVLVPPVIMEETSSADTVVREGDTVTLVCNATGVPTPNISWYRIPHLPLQKKEKIGTSGEVLIIHNVSRDCGGTYECEAENGVLDYPVKRQMTVDVQYPPEVNLPNHRLGQYPNKETFLQCFVTAHPHGLMSWSKDGKDLPIGDRAAKHIVEIFSSDREDKKILTLRIRAISKADFGRYTCTAKNFLGQDKETMVLYDYSPTLTKAKTTTTHRPTESSNRLGPDHISGGGTNEADPKPDYVHAQGENMGALGSSSAPGPNSSLRLITVVSVALLLKDVICCPNS